MEKADLEKARNQYKEALKQYKKEQKELKQNQKKSNLNWFEELQLSIASKIQKVVEKKIGWINFKKEYPKEYEEAVLLEDIEKYVNTLSARLKKNKPLTPKHQAILLQTVAPLSIISLTGSVLNKSRAVVLLETINGLLPKKEITDIPLDTNSLKDLLDTLSRGSSISS